MTKEAKRDFVEENPYITWTPKKDDVNASGGGEGGEWVEGDPLINPTDSDYLSSMDIENYESHKFSFASLWGWINAKFAGASEKPILSDDDATINIDSGNNFFKFTIANWWSWIKNKIVGSAQDVASDDDYVVSIDGNEGQLKKVNYENLWDYILGKITINTDRGLNVENGKIGHINHIAAQSGQTLNVFDWDNHGHINNISPKTLGRGLNDADDIIGHINNLAADTDSYLRTFRYDAQGHVTSSIRKTLGGGISDTDNEIGHSNIVEPDETESLKTFTLDANGHITAYHDKTLGRGINDTSGVIGHSNSLTAQTSGLKTIAFDAYGHISSATAKTLGRGISDSSNTIGHSNTAITAKTNNNIVGLQFDTYGHITAKGTEYSVSDTYTSTASNQLFTRAGAYSLYNNYACKAERLVGIFSNPNAQAGVQGSWKSLNLTSSNDVDTNYCELLGNRIVINKNGIYRFTVCCRLQDTPSTTTLNWTTGVTGATDDSSGGQWLNSTQRHKMTQQFVVYKTASSGVYPMVYVENAIISNQYVNVIVEILKE